MKSIHKIVLTTFVMLSTIWCQSQNNNIAITQTKDNNSLNAVFNNYFSIKDALVKTDSKTASAKSKDFMATVATVNIESLNASEKTAWKQLINELNRDAKSISETGDIKKQREAFKSLSKNTYTLLKASATTEPIYYDNCPMADANWLSREKSIKNPYYGSQMMTCGKIVETVK